MYVLIVSAVKFSTVSNTCVFIENDITTQYLISVTLNLIRNILFFLVRKIVLELAMSVAVFLYFVCGTVPQHGLMSSV